MNTAEYWLQHCAEEMNLADLHFGHGTDNSQDEAAWMLLHILNAPLDGSFQDWDRQLDDDQETRLLELLQRRINERVPLAYLTGTARFCGLDFKVTDQTLVPRSPIAELILNGFAPWLKNGSLEQGRALDMCTGGGCIAIAMAEYMPEMKVDAVDISAATLEIAQQNVIDHDKVNQVNLIQSDLFDELKESQYDLIVSNPPYVSAAVFEQLPAEYLAEPSAGLVCGEDGLDIVLKILDASPHYLKKHGILVVEVGESAETLMELLPGVAFLWLEFDHGGDGVFLLDYEQLQASHADVKAVLEQRQYV